MTSPMNDQEPVVVIGSGFGGLAAAVRLRAMGHPVVVLEAADQPGGRARVFRREGFTFDAGPTVITAPYLFDELFELVGRDRRGYFDLMPVDPFYRVEFSEGEHFDYVGDEERLLAQIAAFEPRDVDGYRRMVDHAKRIFEVGYVGLADQPFGQVSDMMRIVPDLVRLRAYKSVYGLVSHYLRDERLRQVFSFEPLLVGGNPFRVPAIYLLIHWLERKWGVHFARGGTTAIVAALVKLLEELGVEVRLKSPVAQIEVENGRARAVELQSGERIACRFVVSNGDPATVYGRLIDAKHRRRNTDRAIARKRYSMSLFVGYFGTRKTFPELAHHTILLGPRYRELLGDIFDKKVLADDFSLYLHAPTRGAIRTSLPPATSVSTSCRRCPTKRAESTGARRRDRISTASSTRSIGASPAFETTSSPPRASTPATSRSPNAPTSAPPSGPSPPSPSRPISGSTTPRKTWRVSTSSAPAPTLAPACPACSRARRSSSAWPHAPSDRCGYPAP